MAAKYHIDVCVNPVSQGITADWNFAYATAKTELVTLAHQDDIYKPEYTEVMLRLANQGKDPMICFSEYYEIREGRWVDASVHRNLHIKKLMLKPLCVTALQGSTWVRRRILSFGNPIGCPLVMYVKSQLPEVVFHDGFASNVDWQTWEALSRRHGRFAYVQQPFWAIEFTRKPPPPSSSTPAACVRRRILQVLAVALLWASSAGFTSRARRASPRISSR